LRDLHRGTLQRVSRPGDRALGAPQDRVDLSQSRISAFRRPDQLRCRQDRKSTRLNSSHGSISYAVFCLKKKNETYRDRRNLGGAYLLALIAPHQLLDAAEPGGPAVHLRPTLDDNTTPNTESESRLPLCT